MMRDCTVMCNRFGGASSHDWAQRGGGLWQIMVLQRGEIEFFCPTREVAFAAWHDEFDSETGFPRSATSGVPDA